MIRGTTPTIRMVLPSDVPVDAVTDAVFSVAQNEAEVITKKFSDMSKDNAANVLEVKLSQEETLKLEDHNDAEMQLKVKVGEDVFISDIIHTTVERILNNEVI